MSSHIEPMRGVSATAHEAAEAISRLRAHDVEPTTTNLVREIIAHRDALAVARARLLQTTASLI